MLGENAPAAAGRAGTSARLWEAALVAALLGLAVLAWLVTGLHADPEMRQGILAGGGSMGADAGPGADGRPGAAGMMPGGGIHSLAMAVLFLWMWLVMMVAMMFPALAPVVVTYDRWAWRTDRSRWTTAFFVGGYLLVWGASGLGVWAAIVYLQPLLPSGEAAIRSGAALLVLAGAYQLSPLKEGCLRHCRSPLGFVARHASRLRGGGLEGTRVGAIHGAYCLGCCWALMLVLILLGMMSLVWMAAVAAVIFLEKTLPRRWPIARLVGLVLVSGGVALLIWPALLSPST